MQELYIMQLYSKAEDVVLDMRTDLLACYIRVLVACVRTYSKPVLNWEDNMPSKEELISVIDNSEYELIMIRK